MTETKSTLLALLLESCPPSISEIDNFDKPFADYGLDSLDVSTFLLAVEEKLGVRIEDEQIPGLNTLNKLAAFVDQAR